MHTSSSAKKEGSGSSPALQSCSDVHSKNSLDERYGIGDTVTFTL
uniref:Uncharacterized protein n=1 Tax=Arundo donax TaxID=35708 RepID=A0A0A8YTE4_ARUDO